MSIIIPVLRIVTDKNCASAALCCRYSEEVEDSLKAQLIQPHKFHPYATFSRIIFVQDVIVGSLWAVVKDSRVCEIFDVGCLQEFRNYGYQEKAIQSVVEEARRVSKIEWKPEDNVKNHLNEKHSSTHVSDLQIAEALFGRFGTTKLRSVICKKSFFEIPPCDGCDEGSNIVWQISG